jgi:hypothetical protein
VYPLGFKAPSGPPCSIPEPSPLPPAQSFMDSVKSILLWKRSTAPSLQDFQFDMSLAAAQHNWSTFESFERSLEKVIASDPNSIMAYGSEFKPPEILAPLLASHPLWPHFKRILENGSDPPRAQLDEASRKRALEAALLRGNHKSAKKDEKGLAALLIDDVNRGYCLPLPLDQVRNIPGLSLQPMGVTIQSTINEQNEIVSKKRLTHDSTFEVLGDIPSHNKRIKMEDLVACRFGWALLRIMHLVVSLRQRNPTTPIYTQKVDWSKAYRREHYSASTALECATQCGDLLLVPLRLTFGGSSNASEFCNCSETVCDLTNELLHCKDWDPSETYSSIQSQIPSTPLTMDSSIPFAESLPLAVDVPTESIGKADNFIDDLIVIILGDPGNISRGNAAAALALELVSRPPHEQEPVLRGHLASFSKLLAEGRLEEVKTILGWILDTRRLLLSLPPDKYKEWSADIVKMISSRSSTGDKIQQLVGRLNHVSFVIPAARHFLGRIRHFADTSFPTTKAIRRTPRDVLDDLRLWLDFLEQAKRGISLNILTIREPTTLYRADACKHGIGGFNVFHGRAWRFAIPPDLQNRATLNVLEFFGSIIGPWVDLLEGRLPEFSCIWSQTDSTTADGWMHKSSFNDANSAHYTGSRKLAKILIRAKSRLASEWIPGDTNKVADSLSRDTDLSDADLTTVLRLHVPLQLPPNFEIRALPVEISSWLTSLLQKLPDPKQSPNRPVRSQLRLGSAGSLTSARSTSTTPFSHASPQKTDGTSSSASAPPFEMGDFSVASAKAWFKARSKIPSAQWHRPFSFTDATTPDSTNRETLRSFYYEP